MTIEEGSMAFGILIAVGFVMLMYKLLFTTPDDTNWF
jgi:hypothetical protein